jgi:hypothetical protein
VAIVIGEAPRIGEVVLIETDRPGEPEGNGAVKLAAELAARIGGRSLTVRQTSPGQSFSDVSPGQLWIVPADSSHVLAASDPPDGAALMMVLDPPPRHPRHHEQ